MQHMGFSFALSCALIVATRNHAAAAGTVIALGFGKEMWDRRGSSGFDPIDLAADITGAGLAVMLVPARGD